MGSIRRFFFRLCCSTPERKASRSHLKAAKQENHDQYLRLISNYTDLAQAYFGASVSEPAEIRMARVEQVFLGLWQHLGYTERLSDFEYLLASALVENAPETDSICSPEPLVTKLRMLSPKTRFAFLAFEFAKWPLRWVSLVMRIRSDKLHSLLSEARCELCGISWESLAEEERECLVEVSKSLEKSPNIKFNKALSQRINLYPRLSEIKAQWLELRPEFVEVRLRYEPSQSEREQLLKNVYTAILETPMEQAPIVDRMLNSVHFSRHGKIEAS